MVYTFLLLLNIVNSNSLTSNNVQTTARFVVNSATNDNTPEHTVINFLKWYRDNEDRLGQTPLIKGGYPDITTFYSIDYSGTEKYLTELKKSNFLSNTFIKNLRRYFIDCDRRLKEYPLNDGPAWGFEADIIMKSQDYMDVWAYINKLKVLEKKITGNKSKITLHFVANYNMKFTLTKIKNRWLIDTIDNV